MFPKCKLSNLVENFNGNNNWFQSDNFHSYQQQHIYGHLKLLIIYFIILTLAQVTETGKMKYETNAYPIKKNESIAQKAFRTICQPTFLDSTITSRRFTGQFKITQKIVTHNIPCFFSLQLMAYSEYTKVTKNTNYTKKINLNQSLILTRVNVRFNRFNHDTCVWFKSMWN